MLLFSEEKKEKKKKKTVGAICLPQTLAYWSPEIKMAPKVEWMGTLQAKCLWR